MILCDSDGNILSEKVSEQPFSNNRIIIANFHEAAKLLKGLLNNRLVKRNLFGLVPNITFEVKELNEGGLSEVERKILIDLGQYCKARKIHFR